MFQSTRDNHQGIKPKQYRIKTNYPLLFTVDMASKSRIVRT